MPVALALMPDKPLVDESIDGGACDAYGHLQRKCPSHLKSSCNELRRPSRGSWRIPSRVVSPRISGSSGLRRMLLEGDGQPSADSNELLTLLYNQCFCTRLEGHDRRVIEGSV